MCSTQESGLVTFKPLNFAKRTTC
uniref:Uncharacterized protein n=1 Tax=Anguilla anguilla TaxID=7936 RepID=A0A0E9VS71_ANGAN